ncbi:hypothetical protein B0H10DRAFT_2098077 [Mycena sp. CBHHK59/15]|nr:hypothetical protein B0H10DRAFT_2098077 [Mycena sp. CBHHK59/15]
MSQSTASSLADSPFTDRLRTNYVPSDGEVVEICSLLVQPLDELARLDAEIGEIEAVLRSLRVKRNSLSSLIDGHKALISHLRRLYQDVLGEIFLACLPKKHPELGKVHEAPMLLGRTICSYRRRVSLSMPLLWCSFCVPSTLQWMPLSEVSEFGDLLDAWLDCSAACPLSISLSRCPITLLIKCCPRITHLELSGNPAEFQLFLVLGTEGLPGLESIRITQDLDPGFTQDFWSQANVLST